MRFLMSALVTGKRSWPMSSLTRSLCDSWLRAFIVRTICASICAASVRRRRAHRPSQPFSPGSLLSHPAHFHVHMSIGPSWPNAHASHSGCLNLARLADVVLAVFDHLLVRRGILFGLMHTSGRTPHPPTPPTSTHSSGSASLM